MDADLTVTNLIARSKLSWDQYLKLAAIPYALGFLTVMFHTASYGFPVVQILQPLNFWVGLIPSLLLLIAWKGFSFVISAPWEKHMVGVVKHAPPNAARALVLALSLVLAILALWMLPRASPLRWSLVPPAKNELSTVTAVFLAISAVSLLEVWVQLSPTPIKSEVPRPMRILVGVLFSLTVISIFVVYVTDVYPSLPQRYGFGKPSNVRLIMDPSEVPTALLPEHAVTATGLPPVISRKVQLLYRTGEDVLILCDTCDTKTLSIRNSAVIGIIWEDSTQLE